MEETVKRFALSSNTIKHGEFMAHEQVYNGYGCTGRNISPDLEWLNPPSGTKSYALIMHDPDAPVQGGFYHWVVTNIPSTKTGFEKGEKIAHPITLSQTSFRKPGYGGPCPPKGHGKHRYIFNVYALNIEKIPSNPKCTPAQIEMLIKPHIIGQASIMAYYERK